MDSRLDSVNNKMRILRFFIYDSEMKCREGEEHKKIIFYWSRDPESLDVQCRFVGLMEGVYRFGSVFSKSSLIQCLATQKTRTVFFSPPSSSSITMVLTVSVPCKVVPSKKNNVLEFRSENMDTNIYRSVLIRSFNMYQFFNGTDLSKEEEAKRIRHFFQSLIPSINISSSSIFDLLPSIRFLTLGSSSFLKVTTLVNKVENFLTPLIHSVSFIHEEKIVWSTLQQDTLILLYSHLHASVLAKEAKEPAKSDAQNPFQGHVGRYLVGGLCNGSSLLRFGTTEYQLVVYGALQSLVVFTMGGSSEDQKDLYKELDSFLGPSLTTLSVDLCDVYGKPEEAGHLSEVELFESRFLYYNASNRALKSTMFPHAQEQPLHFKIMCDVYSDFEKLSSRGKKGESHYFMELDIKSSNNQWVVGRKSGDRLFFVASERNSNLIELTDSVEKIVNEEFKNICLLEK